MENTEAFRVLIKTQRLTRIYFSGKIQVTALKDVSLELGEGVFVAVCGVSGSGKSTLLNLLGGLDTPTSGTIEVEGCKISDLDRRGLALYRRFSVGIIFQSFNLIPSFRPLRTSNSRSCSPACPDGKDEEGLRT
ncbi:MAG: ATP-binding cassette domain-containing protein [Clostridiales bacterium]|jgi:putative ABC transport system ATP-binding protein|nr:ATP-binding cassette domain-containing protein [Clostridiales bacterium]